MSGDRPTILRPAALVLPAVIAVLLVGLVPGSVAGRSVPPQGRIWAPVGDTVGLAGSMTFTLDLLDARGSASKLAELTGLVRKDRGTGLLVYASPWRDGRRTVVRGWGDTDDARSGTLRLWSGAPAGFQVHAFLDRTVHYDDPTGDDPQLARSLQGPLFPTPQLRRDGLGAAFRWHLSERWLLRGGYVDRQRFGDQASLSRGVVGPYTFGPPGRLHRGGWSRRAYLAAAYRGGRLSLGAAADFQRDGGRRSRFTSLAGDGLPGVTARESWRDWRETVHLRLDATYDASRRVLLFGGYGYTWRNGKPSVVRRGGPLPSSQVTTDGVANELSSHTGRAGLLVTTRGGWRLRLLGRLQSLDQTGNAATRGELGNAWTRRTSLDRERRRTELALAVSRTRGRTRCRLAYRYRYDDEDANTAGVTEYLDGNVLVMAQASNRTRERHDASLRVRHRLADHWTVTQRLSGRRDDIDQANPVLEGQYAQGDRRWRRWTYRGALRWRPRGRFSADAGYQLVRETFERRDIAGVKTTWHAGRVFLGAAWLPERRVSVFLNFAYGREDYDIDGSLPAPVTDPAVFNPVTYETETYRLSPGVLLHPADGWTVEGHYERVRNRDSVANDTDRWYGRVSRELGRTVVTAAYRRWQYDENLGDDVIADLYLLSLTARF